MKMTFEGAARTLECDNPKHPTNILQSFHKKLIEFPRRKKSLVKAKDFLLTKYLEDCMIKQKPVKIKVPTELGYICSKCKGTGFDVIMEMKKVDFDCPKCNGTGILTKKCRRCNGLGTLEYEVIHIGKENQSKIEKMCKTCKGTGVYVFRENRRRKEPISCPLCQGSGKRFKLVPTGRIKTTIPCKECNGLSWIIRKPFISEKTPIEQQSSLNKAKVLPISNEINQPDELIVREAGMS